MRSRRWWRSCAKRPCGEAKTGRIALTALQSLSSVTRQQLVNVFCWLMLWRCLVSRRSHADMRCRRLPVMLRAARCASTRLDAELNAAVAAAVVRLQRVASAAPDCDEESRHPTLVACGVLHVAADRVCRCDGVCTCQLATAFGVNFGAHKRVNLASGCMPLRGLLKGCAEQNALGVVAASGVPFCDVRGVVVVTSGAAKEPRGGDSLPCPSCQRMLSQVGRLAAARCDDERLPLRLFRLCTQSAALEAVAVCGTGAALDLSAVDVWLR